MRTRNCPPTPSRRSPRTPATPGPTARRAPDRAVPHPGGKVYCLLERPAGNAIRRHHAALGAPRRWCTPGRKPDPTVGTPGRPGGGRHRGDQPIGPPPGRPSREASARTEHPNMQPPIPSTSKSENAPYRRCGVRSLGRSLATLGDKPRIFCPGSESSGAERGEARHRSPGSRPADGRARSWAASRTPTRPGVRNTIPRGNRLG
jgi:hypothetical protein